MQHFPGYYLDACCIQTIGASAFHGKHVEMSENRPIYRVHDAGRAPLVDALEAIYQRAASAPASQAGRVLAAFASSLTAGHEFDLSQIERLEKVDQALCLAAFDYCMHSGLTEEERSAAAAAFEPFIDIHTPGRRH